MPPPFFMVTDEKFFMITIHSWEIDAEDFLKYITFGSSTSLNCFIVKCFFSFSNLMEFFWLFHVRCFLHHNPMLIASAGTLQRTLKPYLIIKLLQNVFWKVWLYRKPFLLIRVFYLELEYLVIALVPSLTACLASSPGRINRTEVWTSRDEIVDLLLWVASFEASPAILSKTSLTNEFMIFIALPDIPTSGWTCFKTLKI